MTPSSARALISWEGEHPEQLAVHRSGIYVYSPEQRRQAEASRDAYQRVLVKAGFGPITTEIVDASEFYRRLGRHAEATESYRRALALVSNEAERRHLEKRLREIAS